MEAFFSKYDVELSELNAIECILEHAKRVKKEYMKNKEKGLKELAKHKTMVEDYFEAAGLNPANY